MIFYQEPNKLAFNRDICCHLVICLRLIASHYRHVTWLGHMPRIELFLFGWCHLRKPRWC